MSSLRAVFLGFVSLLALWSLATQDRNAQFVLGEPLTPITLGFRIIALFALITSWQLWPPLIWQCPRRFQSVGADLIPCGSFYLRTRFRLPTCTLLQPTIRACNVGSASAQFQTVQSPFQC
jgi:hypothetical protein